MGVVCFFPMGKGLGVVLDEERVNELERFFMSRNPAVNYGFDFEEKAPYIQLGHVKIPIPSLLMEGIYRFPLLYVYVLIDEKVASYVGKIDLDPVKLIQIDSVGRTSSEFLNIFGPAINFYQAQFLQDTLQNNQIKEDQERQEQREQDLEQKK